MTSLNQPIFVLFEEFFKISVLFIVVVTIFVIIIIIIIIIITIVIIVVVFLQSVEKVVKRLDVLSSALQLTLQSLSLSGINN